MATGNSKAAKSARVKLQLRDKNGRWIEMGGGVKWYSPNLGKYMFGTAVDSTEDGLAVVEVKNPNPDSKEKIFTVKIAPSQLEKVKAKASLDTNVNETIKPTVEKEDSQVEPAAEKNNKLFENLHKNPAGHEEPFGPDYESVPFDKNGTNNLQKNDLVVYGSEGTVKKGQVIGTDKATGKPIIQPEVSSSWGFGGKGMPISLDKIWNVYKPKISGHSNKSSQKKADILVPSVEKLDPKQIAQNLSGPTQTAEEKAKTEKEIADYKDVKGNYEKYKDGVPQGKKPAMSQAQKLEQEAADADTAAKKDAKLNALMAAKTGTRLLSADEKTINLVKQDGGYWTEEGTGKNFTSTQVVEEFAGEKSVSMIEPEPTPTKPGELSSKMTSEEFKQNISPDVAEQLKDTKVVAAYTVPDAAYMYSGYTQAELDALEEYVGDSSFINQALRLDNSAIKSHEEHIAGLDQLLDKSPLVEATSVWRGIRANPTVFEAMLNGGTYHDFGYSSTSSNEKVARDWIKGMSSASSNKPVTIEMKLPAGFKAHKIDYSAGSYSGQGNLLSFDEEEEVIIPRNTMFKVVSMQQNTNNAGYTAVVEPILTKHNSIEGAENDGSNTGDNTGTKENTDATGNGPTEESGTLPIDSGNDNVSDGGTDSGGSGEAEPVSAEPEQGNEAGPITETPAEAAQEVGKLYTDDKGQYMLGNDGAKFRNGDTVSYTKKGVTEEGKIVALYEGVKSARVEFPDGTKSVKKINTLKSVESVTEDDTAPNGAESVPIIEAPNTLEAPVTIDDFATPEESFDKSDFSEDFPVAVADLPVGTVLRLKSNSEHVLKKIGDNNWRHANDSEQQINNSSVEMAMGLKNNGKPSYDIYMPKGTAAPETAPVIDAPTTQESPVFDMVVPETKITTDNFQVTANMNGTPGSFHVKTKDKSAVSVSIADLKEGDVIYPIGSQSKPYGTHNNYAANQVYIDATLPAGMGTVTKNDPSKPYIQVKGTDGEMYFPSKHFVATKQSDEIDKLISDISGTPAFKQAQEDAVEEVAAPEELAEMETATTKSPVNVSTWKKLKNSSGSNPGGEYEAPDGTHYFIKQSKSDLHAKNEILASDIYQAAGIDSLELGYADVNGSGKLGTIAPMISGAKNDLQSKLATNPEYKKQFQKGWAVDAWLGNWDVVGLEYDNAVTDDQGKAIRVDPGGALLFRAMGSPKSDAMFGDSVGEWDSMRTDLNNYQTNDAFGDMTDAQIKESVAIVAGFSDKMIDDLVDKHDFDQPTADKLKMRLKNRRDDLIKRANALPGEQIEAPLAQLEKDELEEPKSDELFVDESNDWAGDAPLADWEKELLEGVIAEQTKKIESVDTQEAPLSDLSSEEALAALKEKLNSNTTFDVANAKPGTVYQLDNGQDAIVGKYNTEIAYGVSVDYFKKNEKKSGIISNILVNQQSAKVIWPDGSNSIIKASQLVGKGKPDTSAKTSTDSNPSVLVTPEVAPASKYIMEDWNDANPYSASDYPVGSNLNWKTANDAPNSYGWEKIGENDWISVSSKNDSNATHFVDTDIDEAKNSTYKMYVPKDVADSIAAVDTTAKDIVDSKESTSVPNTKMNWLQQDGKAEHFPVGTVVAIENGNITYTKTAENNWLAGGKYGSGSSYPDSDLVYLDKKEAEVILPDGFSFFDPSEKYAVAYPINTTINKGPTAITKIDDYTWETKSGISYANHEIDSLSMPSTWIIKEPNLNEDSKKENEKDFFTQVEEASNIFSKTYESYVQTVGEENSSWDEFADEFGNYLPDEENNSVEINGQSFFLVPDYSTGPDYKVKITDEFGKTHGTASANSSYGSFDSYYLNSQLDDVFAKISNSIETDNTTVIDNGWKEDSPAAEDMPTGSKIIGQTITLTKKSDGEWVSSNSGQIYTSVTINGLKATPTHDYGWKFEVPGSAVVEDKATPEATNNFVKKSWDSGLITAADLPLGAQISTGTGTGELIFEKTADNSWSPTEGSTGIVHADATMESLKGGNAWKVSAPASAFEPKAVPAVPGNEMTVEQFSSAFDNYFDGAENTAWATFKSTELEFEVGGKKFIFAPHPMSTSFAPYMQLQSDGQKVFSENDFEINGGEPYKFGAIDVYEAAENHAKTFAVNKPAVTLAEFTLGEGNTLADISYEDFIAVPSGTKIDYIVNGKVFGTYQKNSNNSWRFQSVDKDKPSHKSESNVDFKFFMENNKEAAANYILKAPDAPKLDETEVVELVEKPKFVLKHQTVENVDQLNGYAASTIIKIEQSSWQNQNGSTYYVKKEDGNWTKFQKTPSTVSEKGTVTANNLASQLGSWYKTSVAISMPTDTNHAVLGTGEHAYVGDTVFSNGASFTIEKINKTALNLISTNTGNKVKIPAKKLVKDKTFGVKDTTIHNTNSNSKYDLNTINPISAFVEAKQAEEAVQKQLLNFAGASSSDYDASGLGLPVSADATKIKDSGLSVIAVQAGNSASPLFNAPKPTMPSSPQDYPSFDESVLDGLPKWDSAEWLKKVEERYLANPNKKFANVQKSTQWAKIEEVLKGNEGYKTYLNQLLNNKYIDQDLFDMAKNAIDAQEKANKPLKKAHNENVKKEKAEYEAKKLAYLAEYTGKVEQYTKDLAEWSAVNVNVGAVKKLPKIPELTNNPVSLTGPADWSQAHIGTHSVKSIMESMRDDNVLGRFGLAAAIDSDKIEETSVVFNKIKDMNGVEKFEVKFKVTHAFGNLLNNKFKADPSVNQSTGIYYPRKTNMIGKPDDDLAKLAGKPTNSSFVNSGTRFEYVDTSTGGQVVFQHAQQTGQNISVNHNSVQLLLDINSTPADFQLALENLGINAKPSTPGALRVVAENKLLSLFSGKSNWGDENFTSAERTNTLKQIKKDYNITVDDVVVETDAWGRVKFMVSDAKAEEFASTFKTEEFHHSIYAGEDLDVWESILSGTNPGLAANYFRGTHGIGELKSGTGMSPDKDMAVGSGAGIFITAHGQKQSHAPYNNTVGIVAKNIFRRLDTWANIGDNYGKNDKGSPTPFKLMKNHSSFHELIARDGIPVSDFAWVTIGSNQSKKKLIERLTAKGIFMINGIPLEKFILTNNEVVPKLPNINSFGTGIEASSPV